MKAIRNLTVLVVLELCIWVGSAAGAFPETVMGQGIVGAVEGDLYSIAEGKVDNPDIVWSRNIPVVGQNITISARVRGTGEHPVPVQFVLEAPDARKAVLSAKRSAKQDADAEYVDYQAAWQPSKAAIYRLTVQVDPDNKSPDPLRENNTVTVTLPVVWRELHIFAWGPTKHLKWITSAPQELDGGKYDRIDLPEFNYWNRRGIKILGFMYMKQRNLMPRPAEYMINYYTELAGKYLAAGAEGVIVDESGSYGTPDGFEYIRRFGVTFDRIRQKYPQLKVFNWIAGPVHREEIDIGVRNDHIMTGECYEQIHARYGPSWRARLKDYIGRLGQKNIIAVGVGGDAGRQFQPQVERSIQLIREIGPDMPGINYYGLGYLKEGEPYQGSYHQFFDRMTLDYFIKPVLTITRIEKVKKIGDWRASSGPLKAGETVHLRAEIRNIGGVPARDVKVKLYAREVATGKRSLISQKLFPEIGNGTVDITEEDDVVESPYEREIDGVRHPMGRFLKTSRVILERVRLYGEWTPEKEAQYMIEAEVDPSPDYTLLQGLREQPFSTLPKTPPTPRVTVTMDDIWLSDYSPARGQKVDLQIQVHNLSKAPAEKVSVKVYARNLDTNKRKLIKKYLIPRIGTDVQWIKEEKVESELHKIVDGTKYPMARYETTSIVLFTRALVEATWKPKRSGHYQIEVELQPSEGYTIDQGLAKRAVPVGE